MELGSGWRWNNSSHRTPYVTGMQVIEDPTARPRRFPVGFAPENVELPSGDLPENAKPPRPFPPQIAARRRI